MELYQLGKLSYCFVSPQDANRAGEKAATLDIFKKAQTIMINPDKPQEQCRFLTLEVCIHA